MTDPKSHFRYSLWLVLAALPAAAGCSTAEAKTEGPAAEAPRSVALVRAVSASVPRHLSLTGTLRGKREAKVAADASGKVVATFAERGDVVASGKPLVRLDASSAALSRAEATAMAEGARVEEAQARADCARADSLFDSKAISAAEHEKLTTACSARSWSSKAAGARERIAAKAMGDATVRAPFSGVVGERLVTLGEYVRAGSSVVTVVELDPLRLDLTVPEGSVGAVHEGQTVSFSVASFPGERFEGKVRLLGAALDSASRSLVVEAEVPNPNARLRPGMFATARVVVGEDRFPVVPAEALVGGDRSRRAFVVRDRRLEEHVVLVGEKVGDRVAVVAGVKEGDFLAARPDADTRDGLLVQ